MQAVWSCGPEWTAFVDEGRICIWQWEEVPGTIRIFSRPLWSLAGRWHLVSGVQIVGIKIHTWASLLMENRCLRWVWHGDEVGIVAFVVAFVVSETNRLTEVWEACSGRASVSCYFPNTGLQGTLNQIYLNNCSFHITKQFWAHSAINHWKGSATQWTWTWANSGRWWGTGMPGVLQSMGSQIVGHDLTTEQQGS